MSEHTLIHALLRLFIFSFFQWNMLGVICGMIQSFQLSRETPAAHGKATGAVATFAIIVASEVISS